MTTPILDDTSGEAFPQRGDEATGAAFVKIIGGAGVSDATALKQDQQTALLTSIDGHVDGLEGFTDGLETLIGSTNTLLTATNGYVDGMEALVGATNTAIGSLNTLLTTEATYLDGVEGKLDTLHADLGTTLHGDIGAPADAAATTDAGTFSLIALVKRLLGKLTTQLPASLGAKTAAASLPVTLATDGAGVLALGAPADTSVTDPTLSGSIVALLKGISSKLPTTLGIKTAANSLSVTPASDAIYPMKRMGCTATATFTPAATAYSANDIFESAKAFTGFGPADAGEVIITCTRLEVDAAALISGEASYDLHFYSVTPPSALADNAAWDLPSGDRASYLGKITLGTPVDLGSTLYVEQTGINKQITVPAGGTLYGYLVTSAAFTPGADARKVFLKGVAV